MLLAAVILSAVTLAVTLLSVAVSYLRAWARRWANPPAEYQFSVLHPKDRTDEINAKIELGSKRKQRAKRILNIIGS